MSATSNPPPFEIHPDVAQASGPPGAFYADPSWYERARASLFPRTWHYVADATDVAAPASAVPATLLEGALDEPLLVVRGGGAGAGADAGAGGDLAALSNVCTHRGALLVQAPCRGLKELRCPYHGRRFALDGRLIHSPEFEGVQAFPAPSDDLPRVAVARWGPLVFAALDPVVPFEEAIAPMRARTDFLPAAEFRLDPASVRDYEVRAPWPLWCENYLEGFHVPWVHPHLLDALDFRAYATRTFDWMSLQIGVASAGAAAADTFDLPQGHPDGGERIAGWYFALFPTTMLNFYPWGLSLNLVRPLGPDRTLVRYRAYVWRPERRDSGAGGALDKVEHEDDAMVESVARGVRARLYGRARYSATREACVHHFHRLLARML